MDNWPALILPALIVIMIVASHRARSAAEARHDAEEIARSAARIRHFGAMSSFAMLAGLSALLLIASPAGAASAQQGSDADRLARALANPVVSNGYKMDVCLERDDPVACIEEAARDCAALSACADPVFNAVYVRADCEGATDPEDCRTAAEVERINSIEDRCDPAYHEATGWQFYADDRPSCPCLRRPRHL